MTDPTIRLSQTIREGEEVKEDKGLGPSQGISSAVSGASLSDLLARVEAATGPDRELDDSLALASGWHPPGVDPRLFSNPDTHRLYAHHAPAFTASLDAALALCERVLPGWRWTLDSESNREGVPRGKPGASVYIDQYDPDAPFHSAEAPTPALALLAAMLKALDAQAKDGAARSPQPIREDPQTPIRKQESQS